MKKFIAKWIYDLLSDKIQGRGSISSICRAYRKYQWDCREKNLQRTAQKLYGLLQYASENIPYYKELAKKNKINLSTDTVFQDIRQFPILSKDIIREEYNRLQKRRKEYKWFYNASGGSTGEPVKLLQDEPFQREGNAIKRLQKEWAGCEFGDKIIKLWGSEKDIFQARENLSTRMKNWIKSIKILNAFIMDENKMKKYVGVINKEKPVTIVAYAHAMNELSLFILKNKIKMHKPRSIMTSAGTLYPQFRKNIERAFNCRVFNRYGSREVGDVACECNVHKGLHISSFTHYVEILDENLNPCKEGESGEIYVTVLTNYTMPLIRYKIGDVGLVTYRDCPCGRGLPLIKEIKGRNSDYFLKRNGERVDGLLFNITIWKRKWIINYQITQKDYNLIEYLMHTKYKPPKKDIEDIRKLVRKIMGKECQIIFRFTKNIRKTKSGKYLYTKREFRT